MSFSQRMGIKSLEKALQTDSMDKALRNGLWNQIRRCVLLGVEYNARTGRAFQTYNYRMVGKIWSEFFRERCVEIREENCEAYVARCYAFITEGRWNDVYDLVEFLQQSVSNRSDRAYFAECINGVLRAERSAYRFTEGLLRPIGGATGNEGLRMLGGFAG